MKLRTVKYMISEGVMNTYKNKLMSLAALGTVIASLLIFGIFLLLAINLSSNVNYLSAQPEVTVYLKPELQELGIIEVEQKIKESDLVAEYKMVTKQEAFEEVKKVLEDPKLLEGLDEDFLMISFQVRLIDPGQSKVFAEMISQVQGVDEVSFPQEAIDVIGRVVHWINFGSMLVLIILLVISVSIIANSIKLTVFARRKEIGIMKYVGATDWFIRWPFIIEGMTIGLVGALVSFIATSYSYKAIESRLNMEIIQFGMNIISVVKLQQIAAQILIVYMIIGIIMGAIGSIVSVRKHLQV